jgi:dihydrofolate synthase/folylpolyglutamate synthase
VGVIISEVAYTAAFASTQTIANLKMRWQIIKRNPLLIYDVSHNAPGLHEALSQLKDENPNGNYHFVLGFVSDKDVNKVLQLFPKDAQYYFCNASIPRAMAKEDLQKIAAEVGLKGAIYPSPQAAADAAERAAAPTDVILCCGSFFIIAELEK